MGEPERLATQWQIIVAKGLFQRIQKRPLFRVAFFDVWLREPDLNRRPSGYEPDELPDCSIPRLCGGILQANGGVSTDNPEKGQISAKARQTVAGQALSFGIGTISGLSLDPKNRRAQKRPIFRLAFFDVWLREPDLNRRPSGYEPDELPDCSIPRLCGGILQRNAGVSTFNSDKTCSASIG